jgi:ABC-2 type transport system permease protein
VKMRKELVLNSWIQLLLVGSIVVLANLWASRSFVRMDLTEDRIYSLDLATRALVWQLDKPLHAKVYFTSGLQAPYNNHQEILMDRLEELRAYSKGWMEIELADPTNVKALEAEAGRFGVLPVQYRFRNENVAELKKVYMGLALVYGDRQESLPAVTQVDTLEYELSRAIRSLLSDDPKPVIGFSSGHGEPDIIGGGGPLATLSGRLSETHELRNIPLGGTEGIPDDVDVLWVVGPQKTLSARALYQMDQFLMMGGALGVFATNTRADMRALVPQSIYHGMDAFLGHFGAMLRRDVIVDRVRNGLMGFPVRQGRMVREVQLNYPLIPQATELSKEIPVLRGIDSLLAPFVSSVELADPMLPRCPRRGLGQNLPSIRPHPGDPDHRSTGIPSDVPWRADRVMAISGGSLRPLAVVLFREGYPASRRGGRPRGSTSSGERSSASRRCRIG